MKMQDEAAERNHTEKTLRHDDEKFRLIFQTSPDSICLNRLSDRMYIDINESFTVFMGYSRDEVIGRTGDEINVWYYPEDEKRFLAALENTGSVRNFEAKFRTKDGGFLVGLLSARLLHVNREDLILTITRDITERKSEELALKRSEEKYRESVENANSIIMRMDKAGNVTFINEFARRFFGYSEDEILGRNVVGAIVPPVDATSAEPLPMIGDMVLNPDRPSSSICRNVRRSGESAWIAWTCKPIRSENGRVEEILCVGNDITEREQIEEALWQSRVRLDEAHRLARIGVWDWIADSGAVYWSDELYSITGRNKRLPAPSFEEQSSLFTPESWERLRTAVEKALRTREPYQLELEIVRPDGASRWIKAFGGRKFDRTGKVIGLYGTVQDITESRQAEESVRASEIKFRSYVDSSPSAIFVSDLQGNLVDSNRAAAELLGCDASDIKKMHVLDIHPDEDRDEVLRQLAILRETGHAETEIRLKRSDGRLIWVSLRVMVIANRLCLGYCEDITERRLAEAALKESQQQFADIINFLPDATFVIDREGKVIAWNLAIESMTGIKAADMLGKGDYEYALPFYGERKPILIDLALKSHPDAEGFYASFERRSSTVSGEAYIPALRGSRAYLLGKASALYNSDGNVVGAIESIHDISKRRLMEEALLDSELRFRTILQTVNEGFWLIDNDATTIEVNPRMCAILGRERKEVLGKKVFDFVDNENRAVFEQQVRLRAQGKPDEYEIALSRPDGSHVFCLFSATPLFDGSSNRIGAFAMVTDITERKRAEKERQLTIELLHLVNESGNMEGMIRSATAFFQERSGCEAVGIRLKNGDDYPYFETRGFSDEFVLAERSLCAIGDFGEVIRDNAGYPVLACMCGNIITGRFDPSKPFFTENGSFWTNSTAELLATSTEQDRQARTRNRCNGEGYESVVLIPLRSGDDRFGLLQLNDRRKGRFSPEEIALWERLAGYLAVALAKFHSQGLLLESEAQFKAMFEMASIGIAQADPTSGRWVRINQKMCEITGYSAGEMLEMRSWEITHYEDRDRDLTAFQDVVSGKVKDLRIEERYIRKDGSIRWVSMNLTLIRDSAGQPVRTVATIEDVTERKRAGEEKERLEAQLRQVQKLEAIGTLAGGIAHDFNNILAPIIGYAEIALNELPDSTPMKFGQEQILGAALRAKDLVKQILAFSRPGREQQQEPVAISSIVKEALKLLRASLPSSIEIKQHIGGGVANADPTQIHQVVMNLCTNAAHAMDDRGVLEVGLSCVDLSERELAEWMIVDLKPGPHLKLTVSDTGCGMDKATLERIFDPYFTTKEFGKGTGLGLAVVHGIVRNHGGAITVRSEAGKGTTFNVFIPAVEYNVKVTREAMPAPPTGTERILLVDDEPSLVEMGTAILERLGYAATSVTDSRHCLEIFRSNPGGFDLIITDYTMPNLNGMDLVQEVRRIRPDMRVILCTGFSEKVTKGTAATLNVELIMKPFTIVEFAELIRKVLDAPKIMS
jgi:PAS domain S-box-containing protein